MLKSTVKISPLVLAEEMTILVEHISSNILSHRLCSFLLLFSLHYYNKFLHQSPFVYFCLPLRSHAVMQCLLWHNNVDILQPWMHQYFLILQCMHFEIWEKHVCKDSPYVHDATRFKNWLGFQRWVERTSRKGWIVGAWNDSWKLLHSSQSQRSEFPSWNSQNPSVPGAWRQK